MKHNYQYILSQSEESEEQGSSKNLRNENGKESKLKSRPIQNCNYLSSRRAWYVIDRMKNKIVNGPFETSKIATLHIEEHESLCCQCVMNGGEILKKFQIDTGVPQNGRST